MWDTILAVFPPSLCIHICATENRQRLTLCVPGEKIGEWRE